MKTRQFVILPRKSLMLAIAFLVFSFSALAQKDSTHPEKTANNNKKSSTHFFLDQSKKKQERYQFNQYEHLFSGAAAFLIGNIGYVASDSAVLKLTYTGIQTIGIINIGQGIYKMNSPSLEESFSQMLTDKKIANYSKVDLASNLLSIFAQENRAKRLSLFYGSSALAVQYSLNAFVYDSPDKLKNIYFFLGGVNAIIAIYTSLHKSDYEAFHYGDDWDLNPFAFHDSSGEGNYGLAFNFSF